MSSRAVKELVQSAVETRDIILLARLRRHYPSKARASWSLKERDCGFETQRTVGKSKGQTKGCPALDRVTEAQNYARTLCFTTSKVVPQKTFSGVEGRAGSQAPHQPRVWRRFGCDDAGDRRLYAYCRSIWLAWPLYRKKTRAMYALLV